jgi:VanZ family protein
MTRLSSVWLLLLYVWVIGAVSLYPFVRRPRDPFELRNWVAALPRTPFDVPPPRDVFQNVLLFVPFGLLAAEVMGVARGRHGVATTAAIVLLLGVLLGATLELAQFYVRDRITSIADVFVQSLGSAIGVGISVGRGQRGSMQGS